MKMFRTVVFLAALLACAPAFAQQTAIHSVPIGKGIGNTGFNAAVPGTAGKPLVSNGATSDPAFGTIANSGFTAGAADTYKGSLNGSTVADIAFPNCQSVSMALRYVPGTGPACGNIIIQTGFDMPVNLGLSVPAPSGGALTINLTQANGSAPTTGNPVLVPFRSTALATGTVTWTTISATQSITIPSGATLGTSNGVPSRVWIFEDYNGGTPELGVATCSNTTTVFACSSWENTLVTSTTISGSSGTAGVLYSTAGVTLDAVRIIGYCEFGSGLATAGTWSSACTTLQPFGPGVKKPGETVQKLTNTVSSGSTAATSTKVATNNTLTITPNPVNLIRIHAGGVLSNPGGGAASGGAAQIGRNSSSTLIGNPAYISSSANVSNTTQGAMDAMDAPGAACSPTCTYTVYIWNVLGSTTISWLPAITGTTDQGFLELDEIQG